MAGTCNICGSQEFKAYRGRPDEQCVKCGSKARHRIASEVYKRHLAEFEGQGNTPRVLHMAPEASLASQLGDRFAAGYVTADPVPEKYPHAECLKLFFPQDYAIFPDGYFSIIIHNHVMEHIPGTYTDHLAEFSRILASGGKMIFSVPGPYKGQKTREGGELLETDEERLEQFLQEDHFKLFGDDLEEFVNKMPEGELIADGIDDQFRASVSVRPGKAKFFIWRKH